MMSRARNTSVDIVCRTFGKGIDEKQCSMAAVVGRSICFSRRIVSEPVVVDSVMESKGRY